METLLQEDATARPMGHTFDGPPPKRQKVEEVPQAGPLVQAFHGARQRKCVPLPCTAHSAESRVETVDKAFQGAWQGHKPQQAEFPIVRIPGGIKSTSCSGNDTLCEELQARSFLSRPFKAFGRGGLP